MRMGRWLAIALAVLLAGNAAAQTYPDRPIKVVNGFAPGGGTDLLLRTLLPKLGEMLGQQLIIDYRPGAGANLAMDLVAKAAPDGYTVMLGTQSTNGSNLIFFPNLPYDPIKDFQPLTLIGTACMALVIAPSIPANTAKEFVDWARKQDGGVAYASAAPGSSQHVAAELLVKRTGIKATHVPYRGSAAAMPDLMSGRIAYMFDNLPSALPQARAGKVKALAQTCAKRSPSAPDLPTMEEAGFPDFAIEGWYGILAPAKTPRPIVDKLSADINKVLMEPASLERWKTLGFDPIGTTPEAFAERQKADLAYWKRMIDDTGIKVE